jgi:hypothetical protein
MADTILTLAQLGKLFYDLSVSLIGGTSPDVRLSWPTGGAPAFKVSDNVAFIKVYDTGSAMSNQQDVEYTYTASPEGYTETTSYTRTLMINWIFYGSDSWSNAIKVRNGIYNQTHRNTLSVLNVYPIPDIKPPQRIPELWMGQWYERVDLSISFNELIRIVRDVNYIEIVPIALYDRNGLLLEMTVTDSTLTIE